MANTAISAGLPQWCWLRNARFDLTFILGILTAAVVTGTVVTLNPRLFVPVLVLDLWFLGYHHVIATYTRLCFDRESLAHSRFLVFGLLPIIAAATLAIVGTMGLWPIISIYFYWQWFHYARQSWGISRIYRRREPEAAYEDGWLDQAIFYALPVLGILYRSYQNPGSFIGLQLKLVPVPLWMVSAAGAAAVLLLGWWVICRVQAWRAGRLAGAHTLYMLSHFVIFAVAYLLIRDITYGWLAINMWHNAQYILFVWMANTRRFADGVDPKARFLSFISQPQRLALYLACCIGITGILYWAILGTLSTLFFSGVAATVVLYQMVNFHHYIVDSVIWKSRDARNAPLFGGKAPA